MAAGRHTFLIEEGSTFESRIEYLDSKNNPIDLTGYQARMHIRAQPNSPNVLCRLYTTGSSDGTRIILTPQSGSVILPQSSGSLGLYISAYSSSMFKFQEAYYDIEIFSGSGITEYVRRILEGKIKVVRNVTRDDS